ncbi:mediator of DNA damage checkpoint protein 1-like [Haliotis asinina]|uniref:mediator of DNA damage checkpoint protein 1-like n=1 Tax=Haliotis asinina TaxID=109174 RepID=UPI0035320A7A
MRTTTILAMAVLGCCCLVSHAYVIGSPYRLNPHNPLIVRRRQIPGFGRAIIYNPTKALRGRATQIKDVAPTPETRLQPAQKVDPPAPQAVKVSPRPQSQNVHPQVPARRQPFPGNTIIIIKEDAPRPHGASSSAQTQGTVGSAPVSRAINSPTSVYDHTSSQSSFDPYSALLPTDAFPAADLNYADPFPADPFFDHPMASADPFSHSRHADPFSVATSESIPAPATQTGVSPHRSEPYSQADAAPGPYNGASQHGYDAFDNLIRLKMLAEMDLPHPGEPHNVYRPAQTHGTPASQGTAQPPTPKSPAKAPSSHLSAQDKYDQLLAQHLAEALDLPTLPGKQMSGATNNANASPADSPQIVASQAATAAAPEAEPTFEPAASPAASSVDKAAATSTGGSSGYHPYDLYSLHLREALDLPPMPPMPPMPHGRKVQCLSKVLGEELIILVLGAQKRSRSGNNPYNQVDLRRQNPGHTRQIIYNPTQTPQRNVMEPTQVKFVAPTREAPQAPTVRNVIPQRPRSRNIYRPISRAQNVHPSAPRAQAVYPPAPRAQNVYPSAPRAQAVYPPAPRAQAVYPPAPRAQAVYPPAPRAQNVYPSAPRAQNVYPSAPRAQNVLPTAPRAQAVYPPAPRAQNGYRPTASPQNVYPQPSQAIKASRPTSLSPIYNSQLRPSGPREGLSTVHANSRNIQPDYSGVNRQSDYYRSQVDQEYDAQPFPAFRRNMIRHQPFPQNTIIIIKEDSPTSRGVSSQSRVHGPDASVPASRSGSSSSPVLVAGAKAEVSPQVPNPEPNSKTTPGLSGSQDKYYENIMRLSMLAEMDLPHYGGQNSLYQLAQSLRSPESKGAAQSQGSNSAVAAPSFPVDARGANHKKQLDHLYSMHLAEALDLPDLRAPGASSASSNPNGPLVDTPNKAAALEPVDAPVPEPPAASASAEPTATLAAEPPSASASASAEPTATLTEPAAYPADKPVAAPRGSHQYSPFDLYLREALDLPVAR